MDSINAVSDRPTVSVIVPTTCELKRAELIRRAIASITSQEGVALDILIVVNGERSDASLLAELKSDSRLSVLRLAEGNVSAARYAGVLAARGEFFCFPDDDDEFLPGAMRHRASSLVQHREIDVLVTNGYMHVGRDEPLVKVSAETINRNPAHTFLASNWFASPASMFRRRTVESGLFDIQYKYFEWTYLFFLLLSKGMSFRYEEGLTYRKYEDNPLSVSKSTEYLASNAEFLAGLQELPLERLIKKAIAQKYLSALNYGSNLYLKQGDLRSAWTSHLKCLAKGGWQFLPYTRHLVSAGLRGLL